MYHHQLDFENNNRIFLINRYSAVMTRTVVLAFVFEPQTTFPAGKRKEFKETGISASLSEFSAIFLQIQAIFQSHALKQHIMLQGDI